MAYTMKNYLWLFFFSPFILMAATYTVTNNGDSGTPGDLRYGIDQVNLGNFNTIDFAPAVTQIQLLNNLEAILNPVTITGNGLTINGGGNFGIFFIKTNGVVNISNMTLANGLSLGGNGGADAPVTITPSASGGGGGLGAGGAVFISDATVTLTDVTLSNNKAQGGNGGNATNLSGGTACGGGAGMLQGNGGNVGKSSGVGACFAGSSGGAGGGGGIGGNGGNGGDGDFPPGPDLPGNPGSPGIGRSTDVGGAGGMGGGDGQPSPSGFAGAGGGAAGTSGGAGGASGGGGGGGGSEIVCSGCGPSNGGGGGFTSSAASGGKGACDASTGGGIGGFGGGGGGAFIGIGGDGGFGGGGGAFFGLGTRAGNGGFGGGGGGSNAFTGEPAGMGGMFGGNGGALGGGASSPGGGGGGVGGALFIANGSGTLTIQNSSQNTSFTGNSVQAGMAGSGGGGAQNGQAVAQDFYLDAGITAVFNVASNLTQTVQEEFGGAASSSISKTGAGTLTLNGTSTFLGTIGVNAGTLLVGGDISSSSLLTVNGGILRGIGTISQLQLNSGGSLQPGSTGLGTLHINSSSSSTLAGTSIIEISPTTDPTFGHVSSRIAYSGGGSLDITGGTLSVLVDTGTYTKGDTWTIIYPATAPDARPITGMFSFNPPQTLPGLIIDYSMASSGIILLNNQTNPPPPPPPPSSPQSIPTAGVTGNNLALANYLNSLLTNPALLPILSNLFTLSDGPLNAALSSISPLRVNSQVFTSFNTQFAFSNILSSHIGTSRIAQKGTATPLASLIEFRTLSDGLIADASELAASRALFWKNKEKTTIEEVPECNPTPISCPPTLSLWADGFGQFASQKGSDTNPDFDMTVGAVIGGMDFLKQNGLLSFNLGYAHDWVEQDHDSGESSSNLYLASFGGSYTGPHFYFDLSFCGSYSTNNNQRNVVFPGIHATTRSESHCWTLTPHLDFGYDFTHYSSTEGHSFTIEPFASFDWAINWAGKIVETDGFPLDMSINANTSSMLRSEVGMNFYEIVNKEWGIFIARQLLGYVNKKPFSVGRLNAAVVGGPGSFTLETFTNDQNIFNPEVEFYWKWKRGFFLSISYLGEFGSGYISNEALGQIGLFF